jgi:flagellar hook-length control protein FliK
MAATYNPSMKLTDKIEDAKALIEGIADDAQKILSMAQISIPIAEGIVKRIIERAKEAQSIFKPVKVEENNVRNG